VRYFLLGVVGLFAACSAEPARPNLSFDEAIRCAAISRFVISTNPDPAALPGLLKIKSSAFNYALSQGQISQEQLELRVAQMQLVDLPNEIQASGDAASHVPEMSNCYDHFR
jgi:hypothetical protein